MWIQCTWAMPFIVFAVVISAAFLHASWNAIVKSGGDKLLTMIMVSAATAGLSGAFLPFLAAPAPASWPYAAASAIFQIAYFLLVAHAYQVSDMSQAYPLMRGAAPLLVALVTLTRIGRDSLSFAAWVGVAAICLGISVIALGGRIGDRKGVLLALLNAVFIAGYTLIDGIGVRRSGAPAAYTLWLFLLTGIPLTLWVLTTRRAAFVQYVSRHWRPGIVGGIGSAASYGLVLWAMTMAPVAVVAALRETSILFGIVIAGLILKEHIGPRRIIAACIIAGGAAILRVA